jgi:uncharacterized protein
MTVRVLLDTNFLLIPDQFKVDIFTEIDRICSFSYELCMLRENMTELQKLSAGTEESAKDRRASKLAIQLVKAKNVSIIEQQRKVFKSADKAIIELATYNNKLVPGSVVVATQDKPLRDKLKATGTRVIVLRQKQYLELQGN